MFNDRASIIDVELNQRVGEHQNLEEWIKEEQANLDKHKSPQDLQSLNEEEVQLTTEREVETIE